MMNNHSSCEIVLDNPSNVCVPGSYFQGIIKCVFLEITQVLSVRIQIFGKESTNIKGLRKIFYGENIFFIKEVVILHPKRKSLEEYHEFPTGNQNFRFSVKLPINLPGSFEMFCAKIVYGCIATVERPILQFNFRNGLWFKVKNQIDLNFVSQEFIKSTKITEKRDICCLKSFGKVGLTIKLPTTALAVGISTIVAVKIKNQSLVRVRKFRVVLFRNIKVTANFTSRKIVSKYPIMQVLVEEPVPSRKTKKFDVDLKVPSYFEIPCFDGLRYLDIKYEMVFVCHTPVCQRNVKIRLPTTVGHIPVVLKERRKKRKKQEAQDSL